MPTSPRPSRTDVPALARVVLMAVAIAAAPALANDAELRYDMKYELKPEPGDATVHVRLTLDQDRRLLREMRFDGDRIADISGDGELRRADDEWVWLPPAGGGTLEWRAAGRHQRNSGGYDAWLDEDWGLMRMEDVIPRAATRVLKGAKSDTVLHFDLPRGWSVVTEYREESGKLAIPPSDRSLTLPKGWMVMGNLGVRRERIAGTRVAVAAPVGEDARRMDMLALLNWTLPDLARILPSPPPRLTIVSAGKPMWRGGLSAPQSLFIHPDRPLISENGTSTLLHEIMHVATGASAERGYDWIVEGFAEYYSLELLRRSGTITLPRYRAALEHLREWGESAKTLCDRSSTGPETALAVTLLQALHEEIASESGGKHGLDDVLSRMLQADREFTLTLLRDTVRDLIDAQPKTLQSRRLPGCTPSDTTS